MLLRSCALGVLALSCVAAQATAQARAGGEVRVNTFTTGQQSLPSVAQADDGRFVVVWVDRYGFSVAGQRFDAAGNRVGAEFLANNGPFPTSPVAALLAGGGFVVTWTQYSDGSGNGIRAQRFDAAASKVGAEFQVNATTAGSQISPSVAALGTGFVVVWTSPQDGDGNGVVGQRFDAGGGRLGGEFILNTATTGGQGFPHVSSGAAGGFVVTWTGYDGSGHGIDGQRFDGTGAPLGQNFAVNAVTTGEQTDTAVARAADGSFVVVYVTNQADQGDILARRFDAAGAALGSEFQVNTTTTAEQNFPSVALDAQRNFVVTWVDFAGDGDGPGVRARRFRADGGARGLDFLVNTYTTGAQAGNPFGDMMAADAFGNFVVTWHGPAPADPSEVFLQRFGGLYPAGLQVDPTGNQVWEPGETAEVRPRWSNVNGAAQTVGGALTALTGPGAPTTYSITDASASYGTLANGASTACSDCYGVTTLLSAPRPLPHWDATVVETITPDAHGQTKLWTLHLGDSFTDVPSTGGFYRFIETLLHRGVTGGCTASAYCPGTPATREQMAVFVLVSKEGSGYAPPLCTTPVFGDVPAASPFCRYVEELARRAVVSGCGGGNYCPSDAVTREQMAIFLLRTLDPALSPPACTTPLFGDVPASSVFCRWIEELARRGITTGCGGGNYCPTQPVTREQMAVFLTTTFGLTLYGP